MIEMRYIGCYISIHALREESDVSAGFLRRAKRIFQSTLSVRRATITFMPV